MGRNNKHKKKLKAERSKVKLKNAKTKFLPKGENVTDASFKIKPIVLVQQLAEKTPNEFLSKRKLSVKVSFFFVFVFVLVLIKIKNVCLFFVCSRNCYCVWNTTMRTLKLTVAKNSRLLLTRTLRRSSKNIYSKSSRLPDS